MLSLALLLTVFTLSHGDKLLSVQVLWRHGLRTPIDTYSNDPYNEAFFGVPDGELLPHGMEQHFTRGQQLRKMYVDDLKFVSAKYNRFETFVHSSDDPRSSASVLANLAGFYADSPTFPPGIPSWPSGWTPIPIHTVPHDDDYLFCVPEAPVCPRFKQLQDQRMQTRKFQDFLASHWKLFAAINANSGDPESYSYWALYMMHQVLYIEKDCNLTMPDWVTPEFYAELDEANLQANDFILGADGFGLPLDQEMFRLQSGLMLRDWMDNFEGAINGSSTLKYVIYSGHDAGVNALLFGWQVKDQILGLANADYASTISCELWERDGKYFIKLLFSDNIDDEFRPFTRLLPCCTDDLCPFADFKAFIQPSIASDLRKECNA